MKKSLHLYLFFLLLLLAALLPGRSAFAAGQGLPTREAVEAELALQAELIWHRLNQARSNPLAEVRRLGLNEILVRMKLGQDAWFLDQGLPPLAFNEQLLSAAAGHGRDMIDQAFFGHHSPAGFGPADRVAATGYPALAVEETMSALLMARPVEAADAVEALVDGMLRDELLAVPGVARNIFSSTFSEVGVAFMAENLAFVSGRPYAYLLVAEFARPVVPRSFVVGRIEAEATLVIRDVDTGGWELLPVMAGGGFQFPLLGGRKQLFYWPNQDDRPAGMVATQYFSGDHNHALDLRRPVDDI